MIDYISLLKHHCKDRLYLGNCKYIASYGDSGYNLYHLEGCEKLKVWHNPSAGLLKVEGSLPYFLKGHNFTFATEELVQSVELLDSMLGRVGLWNSIVMKFENGVIVPVDEKPKEYISHHHAGAGSRLRWVHNDKYNGKLEMWQGVGEDIKLYDAGANIEMKQGMLRREVIEEAGWNPAQNFLKCEVRYTKPAMLNANNPVILEKLQNETFAEMLKRNLMDQYHLLSPSKSLVLPSDKKNFSSLDAVIYALAGSMPFEEAKRLIYYTINHADCLSKSDKDGRKAQIRKAFKKLELEGDSRWDLTGKLEDALEAEK